MLSLGKYSIGISNYFTHQGVAHLDALQLATENGFEITPVWSKSFLVHNHTKSTATDFFLQTKNAVEESKWTKPYFIDSENINHDNISFFVDSCNYFTFSVSDYQASKASEDKIVAFTKLIDTSFGSISITGIEHTISFTSNDIYSFCSKYLGAVEAIGLMYNTLVQKKKNSDFICEISLAECENPLSIIETYFLFSAFSLENIPVQVFSPRFSGRFLRSVDFDGKLSVFENELKTNILLLQEVQLKFAYPHNLKIGIHNSCDKPSIYPVINKVIKQYNVGIHLKTSSWAWLNECITLINANEDTLDLIKSIYAIAVSQQSKLIKPYKNSLTINETQLPTSAEMFIWNTEGMNAILDIDNEYFNINVRQLLSISYQIAVEYGDVFLEALKDNNISLAKQQQNQLYSEIIKSVFIK